MIRQEEFDELGIGHRIFGINGIAHVVTNILQQPKDEEDDDESLMPHNNDSAEPTIPCKDGTAEPSMPRKDDFLLPHQIVVTVFPAGNCIAGLTVKTESGLPQNIFWSRDEDCIVDENGNPSDLFDSSRASCGPSVPSVHSLIKI